jgi:phospholipid-binding lipoprotein MlaA
VSSPVSTSAIPSSPGGPPENLIVSADTDGSGTRSEEGSAEEDDEFYDPFEDEENRIRLSDPLESWNRGVFYFNDGLYYLVLRPSSRGWEEISSSSTREGVSNFFANLREPRNFLNSLFQGEFRDAERSLARFVINTTIGVGGLFDVLEDDLPVRNRTFDQTLGRLGIGPGPYLVLPFYGPSSIRGSAGLGVDSMAHPTTYTGTVDLHTGYAVALHGFQLTNEFVEFGPRYEEMREVSVDPYLALKSFYENRLERRRSSDR